MFSPIAEKPMFVTNIPPPKSTDFLEPDTDPYSEYCTEQLDKLNEFDEEFENSSKTPLRPNNVCLKLLPLEAHKENESKTQRLTTPGKNNISQV